MHFWHDSHSFIASAFEIVFYFVLCNHCDISMMNFAKFTVTAVSIGLLLCGIDAASESEIRQTPSLTTKLNTPTNFFAERIVCYYGAWSTYRHGNGAFNVKDIDPNLCTHYVYSFFGLTTSGTVRFVDSYLDLEENWGRGNINKFNKLKLINPKLKTLAAIGGWNEGSRVFSQVWLHTLAFEAMEPKYQFIHRSLEAQSYGKISLRKRYHFARCMDSMALIWTGNIRAREMAIAGLIKRTTNCFYAKWDISKNFFQRIHSMK